MGRTKNPIMGQGPVASFAMELRRARADAGEPTYRRMEDRVHAAFGHLASVDRGNGVPTWESTELYLKACGITAPADLKRWRKKWEEAQHHHAKATRSVTVSVPAPPAASVPQLLHPDPARVTTQEQLAEQLRLLRLTAGNVPYRAIHAELSHSDGYWDQRSVSTIGDIFTGKHMPAYDVFRGIVSFLLRRTQARAEFDQELASWINAWMRAERDKEARAQARAAKTRKARRTNKIPKAEVAITAAAEVISTSQQAVSAIEPVLADPAADATASATVDPPLTDQATAVHADAGLGITLTEPVDVGEPATASSRRRPHQPTRTLIRQFRTRGERAP